MLPASHLTWPKAFSPQRTQRTRRKTARKNYCALREALRFSFVNPLVPFVSFVVKKTLARGKAWKQGARGG
jgi:hypothetical protein